MEINPMNLTKLILIGGVALIGAITSPMAQARDHDDRHRDRDRDYREYRHHHHRHYHGWDRRSAYEYRRGSVYRDYRSEPRTSVTIAVGGHRHHRR